MIVYRVVSDTDSREKMRERCKTLGQRITWRRIQYIGRMDTHLWPLKQIEALPGSRILLERVGREDAEEIGMVSERSDCDGYEVVKAITVDWQRRPDVYYIMMYLGYAIHVGPGRYMLTTKTYGHLG